MSNAKQAAAGEAESAANSDAAAARNSAQDAGRLLAPEMLARFSNLELLARTVAEGVLTGLHRSPHFGFSQEFAEYRAYNEGDDLRFVDWNVYARTDRTYIKRYRADTNTSLMLAVDVSGSMNFSSAQVSKLMYAQYLAATLAWLARKQHDAIGSVFFNEQVSQLLPPSTRPDALPRLLGALERIEAEQGTDVNAALDALNSLANRRGLMAIISDFYGEPAEIKSNLQALVHRGQDISLFHIIDPAEKQPEFASVTALRDLESGQQLNVDPTYLSEQYPKKFAQHCQMLSDLAVRLGVLYTPVLTSEPLDETLHWYLQFRQRRV